MPRVVVIMMVVVYMITVMRVTGVGIIVVVVIMRIIVVIVTVHGRRHITFRFLPIDHRHPCPALIDKRSVKCTIHNRLELAIPTSNALTSLLATVRTYYCRTNW